MKGLLKFVIISLIILSVTFIPLSIWLKTDSAKKYIESFISDVITEQFGLDITITNLNLSLPFIANAERIIVSSKSNELIIIKDFHINVLPSLFSFWEVNIWSVSAHELHVLETPNMEKTNTSNSVSFFNPNIIIQKASIEKIILYPKLTNFSDIIIAKLDSYLEFDSSNEKVKTTSISNLTSIGEYTLDENSLELIASYDGKNKLIEVTSAKIQSDIVTANGRLKINMPNNQIAGEIKYDSSILTSILSKEWEGIKGTTVGTIKLLGSIQKPEINASGNIAIDLPQNDYFNLPSISWNSRTVFSGNNFDGTLELKQDTLHASGEISRRNNQFYLRNFRATAPNFVKAITSLMFDFNTNIITGTVTVHDETLSQSKKFFPFLDNGALEVTATYSSPDNEKQHVSIKGKIRQLSSKFGNYDFIDVNLNSPDLWNFKLAESNLVLGGVNFNDITVREIKLNAHSNDNHILANASILSNQPYPIDLSAVSTISILEEQGAGVIIHKLLGNINNTPIKNTNDITLNFGKETTLELKDLLIGNGSINISTNLSEKKISGLVKIENLPIQTLPGILPKSFKESLIECNASLAGSSTLPILKADINISNISLLNTNEELTLKISTDLTSEQTNTDCKAVLGKKNIAFLTTNFPNKFRFFPFQYNISNTKPFEVKLLTVEDFDLLSLIPVPIGHTLTGIVKSNLIANGTLNAPLLKGVLELNKGKYAYKRYGIKIQDISTKIIANDYFLSFTKIAAKDRFNNELSGSGNVSLNNDNNYNFTVTSEKFDLINTPYLHGETKGTLSIIGNKELAKASGKFTMGPLEIKIPEHFQQDIPELNIAKIVEADKRIIHLSNDPYQLELDIALETTNQVYVRGWGVDTSLKGNLVITGHAHDPTITGILKSVRGRYQEFGRTLNVKEGILTFDGPISPSPYLNIIGVAIEGNTEIRLILSGPIQNPDITIESTPAMSQEAALSTLLFGGNPEDISTFQALQLANGMRRLSGHGGGFDPLGLGRKILGVDSINFKSDSENPENNSVGVGKYLTDKVYFEVEAERQEASTKTKIEVQITPKISLENVTEQEGSTFFGINWRFDY